MDGTTTRQKTVTVYSILDYTYQIDLEISPYTMDFAYSTKVFTQFSRHIALRNTLVIQVPTSQIDLLALYQSNKCNSKEGKRGQT